jgi:hypothetical protein
MPVMNDESFKKLILNLHYIYVKTVHSVVSDEKSSENSNKKVLCTLNINNITVMAVANIFIKSIRLKYILYISEDAGSE